MLPSFLRRPGQPPAPKSIWHHVPRGPRREPLPHLTLQLRLSPHGCPTRVVPELAGELVRIGTLTPAPDTHTL